MTTTMTLADLAATSLSAIRILEQHGWTTAAAGSNHSRRLALPRVSSRRPSSGKLKRRTSLARPAETGRRRRSMSW
jgi:hypothetical protein